MSASWPSAQKVIVPRFAARPEEAIEQLIFEEDRPPAPDALAPDQVLVQIERAAVGWVDLLMTSGQYQHMPRPPYCPGMEYSGRVLWAGSAVSPALLEGTPVMVDPFLAGPRSLGDYQRYGGFARYAVVPGEAALPIPEGLSMSQSAGFLGSFETAYHCLITCGQLQAKETILIHGASGATGLAAVQLAKHLGATVIATGRSEDKLKVVKAQGADHLLRIEPEGEGVRPFRESVKALTEGQGVDVVFDAVGGAISIESLRCVKFGARFLITGWAATPDVARGQGQRGAPRANMLPTNLIMMKGLRVLGCPAAIAAAKDPALRKKRLLEVLSWSAWARPYISHEFALGEVKAAMRAKWSGQVVGGCVLRVPD